MRSPIAKASRFINLKDGGVELVLASPKGSGTPKTLRWWKDNNDDYDNNNDWQIFIFRLKLCDNIFYKLQSII